MERTFSAPEKNGAQPQTVKTSSVASHRRGERMRTYVQHPRPEARM